MFRPLVVSFCFDVGETVIRRVASGKPTFDGRCRTAEKKPRGVCRGAFSSF
jgi:hypothetical protein